MTTADKIQELYSKCGEVVQVRERKKWFGLISYVKSDGWVSIKDEDDYWSVMWTTSRDTHQRSTRHAYIVDFRKDNGERRIGPLNLTGVWQSAISMWPVENEVEIVRLFLKMVHLLDLAHRYHVVEAS